MLRTIIVDDEPIIRADIESLLEPRKDIVIIGACGSVQEAIILINILKPDLLLLDIHLSDGISFDIINAIPNLDCAVIFITAYDKHAIQAIRIGALDYLLKPVVEEELYAALDKVHRKVGQLALQTQETQKNLEAGNEYADKTIVLRSQREVQLIKLDDIIFCEGDGNYTTFYLTGNKKIVVSKPLKEYDDLLPRHQFIRTHQSYLVSLKFIHHYDREGILHMKNGVEVPVSVRKRELVRAHITGGSA